MAEFIVIPAPVVREAGTRVTAATWDEAVATAARAEGGGGRYVCFPMDSAVHATARPTSSVSVTEDSRAA